MLAALLLAGIVAAPLGSAGLLAGTRRHARVAGAWPATRRLVPHRPRDVTARPPSAG
jgi:hypothetical protein